MSSKCQIIIDFLSPLLLLLLMGNLTVSNCDNLFGNSSINCSSDSQSVYSYANDTLQSSAVELFKALSNVTNGSYCKEMLDKFLCSVIFPPFNQSNDGIQTLCPESCQNYVSDGICAIHVEAMVDLLMRRNMNNTANNLNSCSSPLLQPSNNKSVECYNLTVLPNRTEHVQCVPLPEDNLCRAFGIDSYAIDVSSKPEVVIFQNMVAALVEDYRVVRVCTPFLNASLCGALYIPCNSTLLKLLPVCENDCKQITLAIDACIDFLNENADSVAASGLTAVANDYNCSNPATYVPTVPNSLYSSQEACRQFVYDTNITVEGPTNPTEIKIYRENIGVIVGPITGTVVVATVLFTIVVCLLWKYKLRDVVIVSSRLHSNVRYGEGSVSVKPKLDSLSVTKSCKKRKDIFQQYKVELNEMCILAKDLDLVAIIGEGAFGVVYHSVYHNPATGEDMNVAVKGLKESSSIRQIESFLEECSKMKQFSHPNVLSLIGVSIDNENIPAMILPYMKNGDVKAYLLASRGSQPDVNTYPPSLTYAVLHKMCCDIANGMEYLCKMHFVHRDLAARNCMVDSDMTIKISDFGLCRDIYESDYYKVKHRSKVPVKWMAPESLHDNIFSHQSDVWSYGITCWEIFSLGRQPYAGIDNAEIVKFLSSGNRLDQPTLCSDEMYHIITSCWSNLPNKRPTFTAIVRALKDQTIQ